MLKKIFLVVLAVSLVAFPNISLCQSKFTLHRLSEGISIRVPAHWKIVSNDVMNQVDTNTEVMTGQNQGNNRILIAANYYSPNKKRASATIRISVRNAPSTTQSEVNSTPESELVDIFKASSKQTEAMIRKADAKYSLMFISAKKRALSKYISIEIKQVSTESGDKILQTLNLISLGNKKIKVFTSFNVSEKDILEPTVRYIEDSIVFQ